MIGGNNDIDEGVQELNINVAAGTGGKQYAVGASFGSLFKLHH